MDRRAFVGIFAGGLLLLPVVARAQQPAKMPTVAVVSPGAGPGPLLEVFYRALREAGYVEDKNVVIARHYMAGREDQYDQVMTQLEQQKVDVIAAIGPPAALAARRMVKSVPVVFSGVGDPVVIGLVASLAKPGGNLTGVAFDATSEIAGKRLELLKEAVTTVSRVAALWSSPDPVGLSLLRQIEQTAQRLRMKVTPYDVRGSDDFDRVFSEILSDDMVFAADVVDIKEAACGD